MGAAAIRVKDLTVAYDRHPAIHHLSGEFKPGSLTAVVGPNGGGKSTLLKTIVGLMRPAEGSIELEGVRAREIAYLPQQAEIDRSFPITVLDAVEIGHWRRVGIFRGIGGGLTRRAQEALEGVGLGGFEQRAIGSLSAGQFQRVLFARMMLQDAPLILLDEPFTAIDSRTTHDLLELVLRWHGESRTIVAVLHDLDQVRAHFPDCVMVARECVGWGRTAEIVTSANLLRARQVSEAWDDHADLCLRETA